MVTELKYSNTNTYLVRGSKGMLLFDTGWAGTFTAFCSALGELKISADEIRYLLISHYHPDHMGIAQEIAALGAVVVVMDVQKNTVHNADSIFIKEGRKSYVPIDDTKIRLLSCKDSRGFLKDELGMDGEILHTPGHSEDSISLCLDGGEFLVGDLNPLYELELHKGTEIGHSWEMLLSRKPQIVYYGHAKTAVLGRTAASRQTGMAHGAEMLHVPEMMHEAEMLHTSGMAHEAEMLHTSGIVHEAEMQHTPGMAYKPGNMRKPEPGNTEMYRLTEKIMKYIDRGYPLSKIERKTGADQVFIEDVARMYLTHQNVGVQGILDRIEIKGR